MWKIMGVYTAHHRIWLHPLGSTQGLMIDDSSYERCSRPGWKKMKWQERMDSDMNPYESL